MGNVSIGSRREQRRQRELAAVVELQHAARRAAQQAASARDLANQAEACADALIAACARTEAADDTHAAALHAADGLADVVLRADALDWAPAGDNEDDAAARLYAFEAVGGIPLHFIAIEVEVCGGGVQSAVDSSCEDELTALYALAEPSEPFETTLIDGRSYVIHATPRAA